MSLPIDAYVKAFAHLKTDRSTSRWSELTRHQAPHKPLLLLAVIDQFAEGTITSNLIELTPDLIELFAIYWSKVTPMGRLRHLVPRPGYESFLQTVSRIHAVGQLRETTLGAKLDDALFDLLCAPDTRDLLRTILIDSYFVPSLQASLVEQSNINVQAFAYSQDLLQQARTNQKIKEISGEERLYRDQGFRRAIVKAYDHRCAICGVRILTADGHTAVAAAHIIPWSISYDDDPRNGLALCHLCHWTFDEGLVTFSDRYQVHTSPQLATIPNLPGHLLTFAGRSLIGPIDEAFWPFVDSIRWHRKEIFRTR